jgi:hypothetical protein
VVPYVCCFSQNSVASLTTHADLPKSLDRCLAQWVWPSNTREFDGTPAEAQSAGHECALDEDGQRLGEDVIVLDRITVTR